MSNQRLMKAKEKAGDGYAKTNAIAPPGGAMDDTRLFLCARCRRQVLICSRCDRGQQYCGARCSGPARRESLRAEGRRYQHSRRGRHCHAERQRR